MILTFVFILTMTSLESVLISLVSIIFLINQEIYRSSNISYAGLDDLPAPTADENYSYDFTAAPTATTYNLRATAQGDQQNDVARDGTECIELTLDQNGFKGDTAACWE